MTTADRVKSQTQRASAALSALKKSQTIAERLAAAKALESAACQLRRALFVESTTEPRIESGERLVIFIGRSQSGNRWHVVRHPGAAFPVAACGAGVSRHSMLNRDTVTFRNDRFRGSQMCKRCSRELDILNIEVAVSRGEVGTS